MTRFPSRGLSVLIGVLLAVVVGWVLLKPRDHYEWKWNVKAPVSDEPFSTAVLDQVLEASLPKGYRVQPNVEAVLDSLHRCRGRANLIVQDLEGTEGNLTDSTLYVLAEMARRGDHIILCSPEFSNDAVMFFGITQRCFPFTLDLFKSHTFKMEEMHYTLPTPDGQTAAMLVHPDMQRGELSDFSDKTILIDRYRLAPDSIVLPKRLFETDLSDETYPQVMDFGLSRIRGALVGCERQVLALRYEFPSGGSILLTNTPVVLTNYGAVDDEWRHLLTLFVAPLSDRPVVRIPYPTTPASEDALSETQSVLKFFLSHPPLQLLVWLFALMGLLAVVVNGRRRCRVVEYRPLPHNSSLLFLKQVAALYGRNTDYGGLLRNEVRMLLYTLRSEFRFDLPPETSTLPDYLPWVERRLTLDEVQRRELALLFHEMNAALQPDPPPLKRTDYLPLSRQINLLHRWITSTV